MASKLPMGATIRGKILNQNHREHDMQFADFASPAFYENPYPLYQKVRAAGELLPLAPGMSITGHHAIVNSVLCDRRVGRAYLQGVEMRYGEAATRAPAFLAWSRMMLMQNPPKHTPVRSALMRVFTPRHIEELQHSIRNIANELIDAIEPQGQADLMRSFALPLPMKVICQLLDVPYADACLFEPAARKLLHILELALLTPEQQEAAHQAALDLQAYFEPIVAARKTQMGQDLISRLLAHRNDGEHFDDDELIANVILLFLAGYETTANMIGNALIALQRHPQAWSDMVQNPTLAQKATPELLRYDSSVQLSVRVALEDIEIAGQAIPAGHIIYVLLGSANHDPAVFEAPEQLRFDRPEHEARVVSFGGGLHFCLGARLAQLELDIALQTLFSRLPQLQLEAPICSDWHQRHTLRGVSRLQAQW
jgi:cytochrome P450